MNYYIPDLWVIVRVNSTDQGQIDKVLGSWYGGFGGSNEWRLSSGITNIEEYSGRYQILNHSGSDYTCYKNAQGMSALADMNYNRLKEQLENKKLGTMKLITIEEAIDGLEMSSTTPTKLE